MNFAFGVNIATLIAIVGAILAVSAIWVKGSKARKRNVWIGVISLVAMGIVLGGVFSVPFLTSSLTGGMRTATVADNNLPITGAEGTGVNTFQPTAVYSTNDKFSSLTITGTSYYKVNGNDATTTAYTNVNDGDTITYWVDNSTYWVEPLTVQAGSGVNNVNNKNSWNNGSATLSIYDVVGRVTVTDSAQNISMGANDVAKIEIQYTGTSKKSAGPNGGVIVAEYNSTISSLTCTGDDLLSTNPYHVNYQLGKTTHTSKQYAYASTLDDGSGNTRTISCQFQNGATPAGASGGTAETGESYYKFTFIQANYYVDQNGDIVLDTEKYNDDSTTRTGSIYNVLNVSAQWDS